MGNNRGGRGSVIELLAVVVLGGIVVVAMLRVCLGLWYFGYGVVESLRASEQEQQQALELILDNP